MGRRIPSISHGNFKRNWLYIVMKVLIVVRKDYGNVGHNLDMSLRSVGVDSICLKKVRHPLKYLKQAEGYNEKTLKHHAERADIIQFMHSENTSLGIGKQFGGRKGIAVYHGGSTYRHSPQIYNKLWNDRAGVALIQTGDLLDKGAKNQIWFLPPVDTEYLKPSYGRVIGNKRIIAHCPSTRVKGTVEFDKIMVELKNDPKLKDKFVYERGKRINWAPNIERVRRCDIYFDACCLKIKARPYGEWGISALEASCLGKVVVSHFLSVDRYKKEFGKECLIQHANSMKEVKQQMRRLILMPEGEFTNLQKRTRAWVVENHSYKVIGERLVNIYNKHLTWEGKK